MNQDKQQELHKLEKELNKDYNLFSKEVKKEWDASQEACAIQKSLYIIKLQFQAKRISLLVDEMNALIV